MKFLFVFLAFTLLGTTYVNAHSWYDLVCCSDKDCGPVPEGEVVPTAQGWLIKRTNEVIPFNEAKKSLDNDFHVCRVGGASNGKVICLYVPPMGM